MLKLRADTKLLFFFSFSFTFTQVKRELIAAPSGGRGDAPRLLHPPTTQLQKHIRLLRPEADAD